MEALLLLSVPIIVSVLTQGVKQLKTVQLSGNRKTILRFFAVTTSFVGVVATAVAVGGDVPVGEVSTYVEAFVAFVATQIPYLYGAKKK